MDRQYGADANSQSSPSARHNAAQQDASGAPDMEMYVNQSYNMSDGEQSCEVSSSEDAPRLPPRILPGDIPSTPGASPTVSPRPGQTAVPGASSAAPNSFPDPQSENLSDYEAISNFSLKKPIKQPRKSVKGHTEASQQKHNMSLGSGNKALPPGDEVDYYNTISADQIPVDLTKQLHKQGAQHHQYPSSYFYNPKDGSYIFPFQESRQHYLAAQDGGIETTLPRIAEKTDQLATRFWREAFAAIRIGLAFPLVLILELVRFISHDIIHSYLLRLLAMTGDFVLKPLLVTLYNSFFLPMAVFIWNVLEAFGRALGPVVVLINGISQQMALILRSFRLVDIQGMPRNREMRSVVYEL